MAKSISIDDYTQVMNYVLSNEGPDVVIDDIRWIATHRTRLLGPAEIYGEGIVEIYEVDARLANEQHRGYEMGLWVVAARQSNNDLTGFNYFISGGAINADQSVIGTADEAFSLWVGVWTRKMVGDPKIP